MKNQRVFWGFFSDFHVFHTGPGFYWRVSNTKTWGIVNELARKMKWEKEKVSKAVR